MNRKTVQQPTRKRRRLLPLIAILLILVGVFLVRGGVTGLAASMADSAIIHHHIASAERWLAIAENSFGNQAHVQFLRGRIARLNGDTAGMLKHLVKAMSWASTVRCSIASKTLPRSVLAKWMKPWNPKPVAGLPSYPRMWD